MTKTRIVAGVLGVTVGAGLWAATSARADEGAAMVQEEHRWYQDVEVHAFASTAYTLNFNRPDSGANALRTFDTTHNSFTLDDAQLTVMHGADGDGGVGFRVDVDTGTAIPSGTGGLALFNVRQGFVMWNATDKVRVDVGKFITWAGAEVIEGWDGYNNHYSHSYLFGYAIPFTHTGARVSYAASGTLTLSAMLTNGWDNPVDNNSGKTWGLNAAIVPSDTLSVYVTYIGGPERMGSSDLRNLVDVVAVIKAGEHTISVNGDFGHESGALMNGDAGTWFGAAVDANLSLGTDLGLAIRAEYFADPDAVRTTVDQNLIELTVTPAWKTGDHLTLRADLRMDHSSVDAFEDSDGMATANQFSLGVNAVASY